MTAAIRALDPNLGVYDERTMSDRIDDSPATYLRRSASFLIGGFAVVALLLSIVGLYGLVAYSVSQRFREIGLRMALGASRAGVYRLVLAEAVRLAALGVALGLAGALALAVPLRQLLFETSAFDAATLGAVGGDGCGPRSRCQLRPRASRGFGRSHRGPARRIAPAAACGRLGSCRSCGGCGARSCRRTP